MDQQAKARVSLKSKRNEISHQHGPQRAQSHEDKKDMGFFDRMLISLGCMKRENRTGNH